MSFRIVAFPYSPPAGAPYADACLPAQPGERLRLVRRVDPWAIVESGGRFGLFPIVFTRDDCQGCPRMRTAAREKLVETISLSPEDNIVLEEKDSDNVLNHSAGVAPSHETKQDKAEFFVVPGCGSNSDCKNELDNSNQISSSGVEDHHPKYVDCNAAAEEEGWRTKKDAPFLKKVPRRCTGQRVSGRRRDGDCCQYETEGRGNPHGECLADARWEKTEEEEGEEETVNCSRHVRVSVIEGKERLVSPPQQARPVVQDCSSDALQELRRQYMELDAEMAWISHVTENVRAERQRVRDAHASDAQQRAAQELANTEEMERLIRNIAAKDAELKAARKCAAHLRSILLANNITGDFLESLPPTPPPLSFSLSSFLQQIQEQCNDDEENKDDAYNNSHEDDDYDDGDVSEPVEELARDANAAAEVNAIKECIKQEQETLQEYHEQHNQLIAHMKRLRRIQAAIEEESCALRESEEVLEAVAPKRSYEVVRDGGFISGGPLQPVGSGKASVLSQGGAGEVDVAMREGFAWPATLPGLTAEEQDALSNYQRLFNKYEAKQQYWQKQHEEATETKLSSVNEKLRAAISKGDMALNELLQRTENLKEFVTKYGPVAESIREQVAVSQRILERQREKCGDACAAYEAAATSKNRDQKR
ncbi:hypothetical protein C4B63_102g51 [Trypanosoma cruzi]|uniref:SH3 domain-containing protein n=1 Tax=Trypanosoma cruzi TaxID=5693 RepID=A0A2V2UXU8_TRYCR|nr:hypothetical protein C4B63_102g51 [Trypanosoma cruzi]